jgi:hypothetical protein
MRRRRAAACVAAIAAALGPAAQPAAAGSARPICGPASAKTVKQEGDVRVYRSRTGDFAAFGCMRGVGRSFKLDSPGDGPEDWEMRDRGPIRIAGRFVAFVSDGDGSDGADSYYFTSVDRVDLRTGKKRLLSCIDYGEDDEDDACEERLRVTGLVLRRTGGFAYLMRLQTGERRVARWDRRGYAELDLGRDVEQRSLRLDGATLSWRRAGVTKTASLR